MPRVGARRRAPSRHPLDPEASANTMYLPPSATIIENILNAMKVARERLRGVGPTGLNCSARESLRKDLRSMTISLALTLSDPTGNDPVPHSTLAYFRCRLKQRIFKALLIEFKNSGLTKADLARRLDKEPAQVSRLLSGPGNVTLDTLSDVLFALSGAELSMRVEYPLRDAAKPNHCQKPARAQPTMVTMTVRLPEPMRDWVEARTRSGRYADAGAPIFAISFARTRSGPKQVVKSSRRSTTTWHYLANTPRLERL